MDENVGMLEALHRGEDDEAYLQMRDEASGMIYDVIAADFEDN
jgi:hypothetical protein